MKHGSAYFFMAIIGSVALVCSTPAIADGGRDLAFEKKSMLWMEQTQKANLALKSGQLSEAERLLKTIITDRINYGLDLSQERSSLAHVYESMGKNDQAEALYKINIKTREDESGPNGYTLEFPLNEYADFLDRTGRKSEAEPVRNRANAIELAANKQGAEFEKKEAERSQRHSKHRNK